MKLFHYLAFALSTLLIISCSNEKGKMISTFDTMYDDVVHMRFDKMSSHLSSESNTFFSEVTDTKNLTIEKMIELGTRYKMPYFLVDYLAITGDKIKAGAPATDFYKYLGREDVSFFSYQDAYYVEESKSRLGSKENFVSILTDDMTQTKRGWARFIKDDAGEFKFDLISMLQTKEATQRRSKERLRKQHQDKKTLEDYLAFYYWQNSGAGDSKFEAQQAKLEQDMLAARQEKLDIIKERLEEK